MSPSQPQRYNSSLLRACCDCAGRLPHRPHERAQFSFMKPVSHASFERARTGQSVGSLSSQATSGAAGAVQSGLLHEVGHVWTMNDCLQWPAPAHASQR